MAVFRVEKSKNYTVMSNYHLRDKHLSLRSIALLSIMLSLPEDWDYSLRGLARICKDGRDAIGNALKELEKYGYLKREQKRDAHGRLSDIEYTVYECPEDSPCPENPDTVNPDTDNPDTVCPDTVLPDTVNPPEQNKDNIYNIDIQSKEKQNIEKEDTDQRIHSESIYPSVSETSEEPKTDGLKEGWMEGSYAHRTAVRKVLEEQIGLRFIEHRNKKLEEQLENNEISVEEYENDYADIKAISYILDIMTDCISGDSAHPVKINGENVPRQSVRDRLMKIDKNRLLSVLQAVSSKGGQVKNKKAYILSALYNEGPPSLRGTL